MGRTAWVQFWAPSFEEFQSLDTQSPKSRGIWSGNEKVGRDPHVSEVPSHGRSCPRHQGQSWGQMGPREASLSSLQENYVCISFLI